LFQTVRGIFPFDDRTASAAVPPLRQQERSQKTLGLRDGGRRPLERPRRVGRRMCDVLGFVVRDVRTLGVALPLAGNIADRFCGRLTW
jgi:hypothetical protein